MRHLRVRIMPGSCACVHCKVDNTVVEQLAINQQALSKLGTPNLDFTFYCFKYSNERDAFENMIEKHGFELEIKRS